MAANEGKYDFLNKKIRIIGKNNGSVISINKGFIFDSQPLATQSIVFDKNEAVSDQRHYNKIRSQFPDFSQWIQRVGFSLYNNYKDNPGFIENWTFIKESGLIEGGYYYIPVLDLNEDDTFNNYNIDEVQYYDENGYLVGYKLTGYLIDVKSLKISEEIICKPIN